jgi:hypothetical protein
MFSKPIGRLTWLLVGLTGPLADDDSTKSKDFLDKTLLLEHGIFPITK